MSNSSMDNDLVAELEQAHDRLERANEQVEEFGESQLETLASVYRDFVEVLERYEEDVTDDGGDYQTNIEFQSQIADVLKDVSDDLLLSETFEECDEALQKKWFSESDFEHVYEQLEPIDDLVSRLEERNEARQAYRDLRHDIELRIRDLDEEIVELERLSRLGDADLDAPTERIREPIEAYNQAVDEAFEQFTAESTAREVIEFVEEMDVYPLVPFQQPDDRLRSYLDEYPTGEETIDTLLEYSEYSKSKLDHYVDDPAELINVIRGRQTYLDSLDAEPLQIDWPPREADELQMRCEELTGAVNRFAPAVVEKLRTVEALPRETEYDRLRDSALAREDLSDEDRERIREGDIETELQETKALRDRLSAALEEYPTH